MKCERETTALGEAIRRERKNKGITQEELAEMLGVTPTHVKHIESGHRKPSVEILFLMADILNLSLDAILFPKNATQKISTRGKLDRILDGFDEASLKTILTVAEALRKKDSAKG